MAKEVKCYQNLLLATALVLSLVFILSSMAQARPLSCGPQGLGEHGNGNSFVDLLDLWGIKSSGPSPPGSGH